MKYIDFITDQIIADVAQIVTFFNEYNYLTWIIMIALWLFWLMVKYFVITLPFRMLFTNVLGNVFIQIKQSLPTKK